MGSFNIIHANNGNILWNPIAFFPDCFNSADGSIIVGTENSCHICFCFHETVGALIAALMRELYICSIFLRKGQIKRFQSFFKGCVADFIILFSNISDFCVSKFLEVRNCAKGNFTSVTDNLVIFASRWDLNRHTQCVYNVL